jgi:hypothetical protein
MVCLLTSIVAVQVSIADISTWSTLSLLLEIPNQMLGDEVRLLPV